jgi:hypothetical protein
VPRAAQLDHEVVERTEEEHASTELASDPERGEPLRRQRLEFERWTEQLVTATGIADPGPAARGLMTLGDGLMLHQLTDDPGLDMRPVIERSARSLMAKS